MGGEVGMQGGEGSEWEGSALERNESCFPFVSIRLRHSAVQGISRHTEPGTMPTPIPVEVVGHPGYPWGAQTCYF